MGDELMKNNTSIKPVKVNIFSLIFVICLFFSLSCAKKGSEERVILKFNNKPVPMAELEVLGQLALSKKGIQLESEEGQKEFRNIAANLYDNLINTYTMKAAAEVQGYMPSADEIEAEFKKFKEDLTKNGAYDQFMARFKISEEQLKETIKYRLSIEKLQSDKLGKFKPQDPSEKEISDFYYQNNMLYRYPKRMRASHIFMAAPKSADANTRQKARERLEQIKKMIGDTPSQTFVGLAQQYSEDKGTAPRGGDLRFFDVDGEWPQAFLQAAFALKEGQVSDVVETDFGYHLIWATDHEQSLEEAHDEIKNALLQKSIVEQFVKWLSEERKKMEIVRLFDPVKFEYIPEEKK